LFQVWQARLLSTIYQGQRVYGRSSGVVPEWRLVGGGQWTCLWAVPHWQNIHALAVRVMDLAICGSKIHSWASASRPMPPASVSGTRAFRYWTGFSYFSTGLLPASAFFIHSGTGLTRSKRMEQMPYSPAHFAAIEEPISCGFFAWPVFADFLHIQFPDFYQQNIDDFRINSVRSSV
jgi:hypothetical protein